MASASGADQMRIAKYAWAASCTAGLAPISALMVAASGVWTAISTIPMTAASSSALTSVARSSLTSAAPSACAVSATVPMRRNPNSQNRQSNTTDDRATAPRMCAWPSRPTIAVATTPMSGVVPFDKVIGTAIASTRALVTA